MSDQLRERAATQPNSPAFVAGITGEAVSWAELDERAELLAGRLAVEGVEAGGRVALVDSSPPWVAAVLHACARIGAALVPLSPAQPMTDLVRHLQLSGVTVVLTTEPGAAAASERAVAQFRHARPLVLRLDGGLAAAVDNGAHLSGSTGPDLDVAVIYTSGSTGTPKGVRLTARNCVASALGCAEALGGLTPDDRWLLTLGTHRVGGLAILWRSVLSGAPVVWLDRFDEAAVPTALTRSPTLASFVPAMLHRLVAARVATDLGQMRAILVGGAPASRAEVLSWADLGLAVCPTYGMTETGSQVALVPPGRARELAGTAGVVHSRAVVQVDASGAGAGEILAGGPVLSPGYLDAGLTAAAFTGDGKRRRLRTGDLGSLSDGVLTVAGRRDRMIITGGEKVSPEEVEAVLREHPGVVDAVVSGRPDPIYGQVVTALVAAEADAEALSRWCRDRLAGYKVPRRFEFVAAIPRSEDGKLGAPAP